MYAVTKVESPVSYTFYSMTYWGSGYAHFKSMKPDIHSSGVQTRFSTSVASHEHFLESKFTNVLMEWIKINV